MQETSNSNPYNINYTHKQSNYIDAINLCSLVTNDKLLENINPSIIEEKYALSLYENGDFYYRLLSSFDKYRLFQCLLFVRQPCFILFFESKIHFHFYLFYSYFCFIVFQIFFATFKFFVCYRFTEQNYIYYQYVCFIILLFWFLNFTVVFIFIFIFNSIFIYIFTLLMRILFISYFLILLILSY